MWTFLWADGTWPSCVSEQRPWAQVSWFSDHSGEKWRLLWAMWLQEHVQSVRALNTFSTLAIFEWRYIRGLGLIVSWVASIFVFCVVSGEWVPWLRSLWRTHTYNLRLFSLLVPESHSCLTDLGFSPSWTGILLKLTSDPSWPPAKIDPKPSLEPSETLVIKQGFIAHLRWAFWDWTAIFQRSGQQDNFRQCHHSDRTIVKGVCYLNYSSKNTPDT